MDFFNETGPLSGLNVKQILLLARYSILLINILNIKIDEFFD